MLFQDFETVLIEDAAGAVFRCPAAEFPAYEPSYEPLAAGLVRVWNERVAYITDGETQRADPFYTADRFFTYLARRAQYQAAYEAAHAAEG